MAKPTLALIPASQGSKLFSVLPSNGSGDFDFTRASAATRINKNGFIETVASGVSRLDYSGGGCPSLLLEHTATNLITYSELFSDAYWTKAGSSVTSGSASPSGDTSAFKLVEDTSTGGHLMQVVASVSNTTVYTASVFVKYAGREWIRFTDAQSSNRIHFNTQTGVFGVISGTVIDYKSTPLDNGWYKISITTASVATAYALRVSLAETDNDTSYTGDGTSGIYIFGAQLEQGSYPTSYIPANGTTVTRLADSANGSGDATVINSTEGVLYFEGNAFSSTGSSGLISLNAGATDLNNRVTVELDGANVKARFVIGGTSLGVFNYATDITQVLKIAVKYKANDFALWVNGTERVPLTSGNSFSANTLSELDFNRGDGQEPFIGNTNDLRVYATALSDAELTTLTTI
tara:strand:+ start:7461 stop:8678 length:1218 start_codon:yes stop_codon:yes gene_type:complete